MALHSLAQHQVNADRARLSAEPALLKRKWTRMAASPLAFLRGASPLWAEALRRQPQLLTAAPGAGGLVGDLHLENFGTFRTASGFTFHVNDFDESFEGPWTFDVLRLLVSTLLARPELDCTGTRVLSLAERVLDGHAAALAGETVARPAFVQSLVDDAAAERPSKLLDRRVDRTGRLVRDAEKTPDAPAPVCAAVPAALAEWASSLAACGSPLVSCRPEPPPPAASMPSDALHVVDVTRRIAGTGSLGVERLQVLTRGDGQPWLLEVKALRGSPACPAAPDSGWVAALMRRALPEPPRFVGGARLGGAPVLVRPLYAGEDRLSAGDLEPDALSDTLHYLGFLAGEVHRRAATQHARWTTAQRRAVLDGAVVLAGLHAQAFFEFCQLVSAEVR
jgi:hypothetical protein